MNPQLELITEQLRQGREVTSNQLLSLAMTESRADVRQFLESMTKDQIHKIETDASAAGKLVVTLIGKGEGRTELKSSIMKKLEGFLE